MGNSDEEDGNVNKLAPPPRLYERLGQLPGFIWDQTIPPFHSTYDHWHVFGLQRSEGSAASSVQDSAASVSTKNSPKLGPRYSLRHNDSYHSAGKALTSEGSEIQKTYQPVVARVSIHTLRIEREYYTCKMFMQASDPACAHIARLVDFARLSNRSGEEPLACSIFENPGRNYLKDLLDFGPAWLGPMRRAQLSGDGPEAEDASPGLVYLSAFLDFAIGATECLELLHHGIRVVHGELRVDAFHFNRDTGVVKLINFGSGPRSFHNGLTSTGWLTLSRELGVKHKLQYIAPEQTGRMPAEPDSRTDLYSLGVIFWTLLTRRPAFDGEKPIDVIQSLLSGRLALVNQVRMDVPDALAFVIRKMTQKQINERYQSTSGLKADLLEIQRALDNGDTEALADFKVASNDVSSFFVLPTTQFGREVEHQTLIKVITKLAYSRRKPEDSGTSAFRDHGSLSASTLSERIESLELATRSSDSSSQTGGNGRDSLALHPSHASESRPHGSNSNSRNYPGNSISPVKPRYENYDSKESIEQPFSSSSQRSGPKADRSTGGAYGYSSASHVSRNRGTKLRRKQRCELITILGKAGVGKSSLIANGQAEIRQSGYYASARFDPQKKAPFEPMLHAMSSLFRQIFSASDVDSEYHQFVRSNVRPLWSSVCAMLGLPAQLLNSEASVIKRGFPTSSQPAPNKSLFSESTDASSATSTHGNSTTGTYKNTEHFSSSDGVNPRSLKFIDIYLEVLRILSTNQLICLCIDDLNFADEESLELISSIIDKKLGIAIMVTCRDDNAIPPSVGNILKHEAANLTAITLSPLNEEQVVDFVATTLCRSPDYVLPLAIVCLEKSNGNPFYLRQMLELCHRKSCIWFSWKEAVWEFDIDTIFTEFASETYGQQLNTDFIARRLQDLPPAARAILSWASLLGSSFSFAMVQKVLSGEFNYPDENVGECVPNIPDLFRSHSMEMVVGGLQAAIQAYILMPGTTEDEYNFAHDRYIRAASLLREGQNIEKMHYVIAMTMMKYADLDGRSLHTRARHVCQAANVIKSRVAYRSPHRELLLQAAAKALESGARQTALMYYETCLALLQPAPWGKGSDINYGETLSLYTTAAELYWHQGRTTEAQNMLDTIFACARTPADRAPAWIFQSKLFSQGGDMEGAFSALKTSLLELGLALTDDSSWEHCDEEYTKLREHLQSASSTEILEHPLTSDPTLASLGAVLLEATSAAFWTDALLFYQFSIHLIRTHLTIYGTIPQIGLGFAYFAMICSSRNGDIKFAEKMYSFSTQLLGRHGTPYTLGRGFGVSALFVAHLLSPIREHMHMFDEAIAFSHVSGDKHLFLLSTGGIALSRLLSGDDMAEVESFCSVAPEDFGDWSQDLRGGTWLVATRQVAKSLQAGRTFINSPETVMSDDSHLTADYLSFISTRASNADRPQVIYKSMMLIPLYLYGHYDKAVQVSSEIIPIMSCFWSLRNTRMVYFYASLSIIAQLRENPSTPKREDLLEIVGKYKAQIVEWQSECDANYLMWSLLIEAEVCEMQHQYHTAIQAYEAAIDHTQLYDFDLELALAFELQASFYVRRGAKRAARATMMDAMAIYSRMGASGKVDQMAAKHEFVLSSSATIRSKDAGVQTESTYDTLENDQLQKEEDDRADAKETSGDRTEAWLHPAKPGVDNDRPDSGSADLRLDVLDLQSILEFNQAISSELQLDKLLIKTTQIITESAGAPADVAAVIIDGENGWYIAVKGNSDGVSAESQPISEIEDESQKQVLIYTLRFKEVVFVHNLTNDDRFSNSSTMRSVLSMPIVQGKDLLGILYLESAPHSFTDHNVSVLQLFCNQMGISIANALLFRRVAKVSAANKSMIESQKRALGKAREAEIKAKAAEAEAIENVRLKEEAAKAKSMFLANVSHELRTPLNGVIGMSELLKATTLTTEQEEFADSIRVCADTLLTVINDILDFSKLEAGKMKLFSVPLNLKTTIAEVVRALSYSNIEKGLQTIEELDLDPKLLVIGDPVRLHQIFMNLLSNSYKFASKGSVTVRARTDFESDAHIQVTCAVADTGIGITQEQVSRLFTPFSQADSSTQRSYGGSGLGLSICKALVNVLNGKISLESQLGVGTTVSFTLTFPKAAKTASSAHADITTRDPDPMATWSSETNANTSSTPSAMFIDLSQIPRDQLRICIAEDNSINQKIAVSFVTKLGFKSEAYADGLQAVEALRRRSQEHQPFHLVLMDVQMPVLDGYDATRLIRKDDDPAVRSVLIVAMTASAIRGDREKCLEAGMNNYLAKPVRAAVLKAMLEEYLAQPAQPIANIQSTASDLAKTAIEASTKEGEGKKARPGNAKRPSFAQRMQSRNNIHRPGDAAAEEEKNPRPTDPVPAAVNGGGQGGEIPADAVPPLSLADGVADGKQKQKRG